MCCALASSVRVLRLVVVDRVEHVKPGASLLGTSLIQGPRPTPEVLPNSFDHLKHNRGTLPQASTNNTSLHLSEFTHHNDGIVVYQPPATLLQCLWVEEYSIMT